MSQSSVSEISNEDARLIEANQLGTPLRIYKLRYGFIRLWSSTIISMIIMGCILIVALLTLTFLNWYLPSLWHGHLGEFGFLPPLLISLLFIACGLFILYVTVPRDRNERVIVCESGLFQNKNNRVEVVRWNEILAINEETVDYKIIRQGGAALILNKFYSDIDDLIAHVKQKGEEEDNDAEVQEEDRTKKKQYMLYVVKQVLRRSLAPTKGDKRFLTVLYCCVGLYALIAFTFLFTGSPLFAWLMYATMGLIVGVEIAALVWRFKDVARQLKEDV